MSLSVNNQKISCIFSMIIFAGIFLFTIPAKSQNFETSNNIKSHYNEGLRLFNEKKYASAQVFFDRIIDKEQMIGFDDLSSDAEYFSAICALELQNKDAGSRIMRFIENHPGHPRIFMAHFQMGKYFYTKKDYKNANTWFSKVTKQDLTPDQLAEFYFKKGFCAYQSRDRELASRMFYELLDMEKSEYYESALYFYSHLEYEKKNYQTAVQGFEKLIDSKAFRSIVPYYIAQIYYLQQRYESVILYVPKYISTTVPERVAEMKRILGDSYFRVQKYDSAAHYLEAFRNTNQTASRYDLYQLGFSYYKMFQFEKAINNFNMVTNIQDTLAQSSYYLLGDCYLQMFDKKNAHLAFGNAWRMTFSPQIQEDALFNYAKLTYELSYAPFNEAIRNFETYLEMFPNSPRRDEIFDYLVKVYLTSKNYKEALASMNRIKASNRAMDNALQRTTYYYAMELFTNRNFKDAAPLFEQSINSKGDIIEMRASAIYWLAETYYRLNRLDLARQQYLKYLETPGAYTTREYRLSNYNLGYIHYRQKDYVNAIKWFNNFVNRPVEDQRFTIDAYSRIGDSFFSQRQFERAAENYAKSINNDYALYQKGICFGLLNQQQEKITTLNWFNNNPTSIYADLAAFETAKAHTRLGNNSEAIKSYQYITNTFPNSLLSTKSQLQAGLIAFNAGENHRAIEFLKRVIDKHPNSSEANEALSTLKNIYLEMNEIDSYFDYAKTLNNGRGISFSEQDSLSFLAAERMYVTGDYQRSLTMFRDYTDKFPFSQFSSNAEFYKAQSALKLSDSVQALQYFNKVIEMPRNVFTVQALYQSSTINFLMKNFAAALNNYQKLLIVADAPEMLAEAKTGIMRCHSRLNQHNDAINAANNVLSLTTIPQELQIEATYIRATSYFKLNNYDNALTDYKKLSSNTRISEGAEAKYRIAQIYYLNRNYDLSEKEIFDLINQATPHYRWLGESFMLLATIYREKGDTFQAKAYLQSLLDNYPVENDGIKNKAKEKLSEIIKLENRNFEDKTKEVIIDISN